MGLFLTPRKGPLRGFERIPWPRHYTFWEAKGVGLVCRTEWRGIETFPAEHVFLRIDSGKEIRRNDPASCTSMSCGSEKIDTPKKRTHVPLFYQIKKIKNSNSIIAMYGKCIFSSEWTTRKNLTDLKMISTKRMKIQIPLNIYIFLPPCF